MNRLICLVVLFGWMQNAGASQAPADTDERVHTEIPYRDGKVNLLSDFQERITKSKYRAKGHVQITFKDILITCDEAEYDEETRQGFAAGNTRFSQGKQWLTASRSEFNFMDQTGVFYDARGFTDQEFLIRGRTIRKTGRDTYSMEDGFVTACLSPHPKWIFNASNTRIRVDRTARLHHMVFKVKGVPVFYAPYLILPMEKKERSSGFTPFHTGNSTSKGRVFSQGYFQTLGPSADATLYGDYFTLRGLAWGGILRARPNADSKLYLQAYGIHDRLDQGGAHLILDGETVLRNDTRAVARVNITSNFRFRQAFADTFRSATIPQEHAEVFLTRNHESYSTNIELQREEVLFPDRSVVIRKTPSFEFSSLGTQIGNTPLIFYLQSGIYGLSRVDSSLETPRVVQRLDFYPRAAVRLPSLAGFSLVPSAGFRETYYGARLSDDPQPVVITDSLHRQYTDFTVDLRTPTLEKSFKLGAADSFKHAVEPVVTYRRIHGIRHLNETIRFDELDAIADTNELEYGLVNRIFRARDTADGKRQEFEFMSLILTQKYFFDPTFGGAFRPGEPNIFYPLNTLTGFSLTAIERNVSPASMALRITPQPGISHDFRMDFDTRFRRLRDVSLSSYWQQGKVFVAGTYFKTVELEPGTFASNHVQAQVAYGSTLQGFSTAVTLSYNIQTTKLLNSHSRLNYMWDCCGVALEFQQFDLGVRTETRVSFSFTLKGIGSFGNLKRPESLF